MLPWPRITRRDHTCCIHCREQKRQLAANQTYLEKATEQWQAEKNRADDLAEKYRRAAHEVVELEARLQQAGHGYGHLEGRPGVTITAAGEAEGSAA